MFTRTVVIILGILLMIFALSLSSCGESESESASETKPEAAKTSTAPKIEEVEVAKEEKRVVETPVVEATAYKLSADDCTDPLPEEVKLGATLMACDGSTITGTLEIPVVPDPVICPEEPNLDNLLAGNIKDGVIINGVEGTLVEESHTSCDGNGQTGCIATSAYKSADLSNLSVGNIKAGVEIAGVTGEFPSATYTLSGASATADLTAATFDAQMKMSTSFEYWDEAGVRYTDTGDTDITEDNIKDGIVVFGTEGTAPIPEEPSPRDLRAGVTVNGVTGSLKTQCRNAARVAYFDGSFPITNDSDGGGVGDGTAYWYETLSDWSALDIIPSELPVGFTADNYCDENNWSMVTATSYKDELSGLTWTGGQIEYDWAGAVSRCAALGKRLPTQKELMQAYINGIANLRGTAMVPDTDKVFWSSTTNPVSPSGAYALHLEKGEMLNGFLKTGNMFVGTLCVD